MKFNKSIMIKIVAIMIGSIIVIISSMMLFGNLYNGIYQNKEPIRIVITMKDGSDILYDNFSSYQIKDDWFIINLKDGNRDIIPSENVDTIHINLI